jgi:hypothetical protein
LQQQPKQTNTPTLLGVSEKKLRYDLIIQITNLI